MNGLSFNLFIKWDHLKSKPDSCLKLFEPNRFKLESGYKTVKSDNKFKISGILVVCLLKRSGMTTLLLLLAHLKK